MESDSLRSARLFSSCATAVQGASAVKQLSASILGAKDAIYTAQGDYIDDENLWQDAKDQYLDAMEAYESLQGSLGSSAAEFDSQIKELSVAYAQLAVPPTRAHIKST